MIPYPSLILLLLLTEHQLAEGVLAEAGKLDAVNFTPNGPAGIFALYITPGSKIGQVFVNELVCVSVQPLVVPRCY